jgi:hypothetical protein
MFAFIAHAEADQAVAAELKAFLKLRGVVSETETGARGFRHLQNGDVVIALWSEKGVFGRYRMMLEKRMLEAWANGRLVLVKLDHSFLPVGLRDLPAIDATFVEARKLVAWADVERAARDVMKNTQDKNSEVFWSSSPPPQAERTRGAAKKKSAAGGSGAAAPQAPGGPAADTVFISYSHADDAAVEPVVAVVEKTGRDIWIDKNDVQTGDGWAGEIVRGIKAARGVMVMCSPHAFMSDHIKREVYLADRYKKPMLPVFIADAKPPEDFEYFFAGLKGLDLYRIQESDRPNAIVRALAAV